MRAGARLFPVKRRDRRSRYARRRCIGRADDIKIAAFGSVVAEVEDDAKRQRALDVQVVELHHPQTIVRIDGPVVLDGERACRAAESIRKVEVRRACATVIRHAVRGIGVGALRGVASGRRGVWICLCRHICGVVLRLREWRLVREVAREGGVLMRSGHTEACVDLCRLASLPPVGVLAELMNDNGSVMRGPEVAAFAQKHKLVQVSIADLIAFRQSRDKLVERVGAFPLASEIGTLQGYAYVTPFDRVHHMAFVYGDIGDGKGVLARLHRADVIGDVFGGARSIRASLKRFKADGRGVIVYLRDGTAGVPVAEIPHGSDTETDAARSRQWREIGLGAQILKDLGISSIRLLTSTKRTYVGLGGFGIEIVSTETLES